MESIALRFTRFTAIKPDRLSKRFTLTGPTTLHKESPAPPRCTRKVAAIFWKAPPRG